MIENKNKIIILIISDNINDNNVFKRAKEEKKEFIQDLYMIDLNFGCCVAFAVVVVVFSPVFNKSTHTHTNTAREIERGHSVQHNSSSYWSSHLFEYGRRTLFISQTYGQID